MYRKRIFFTALLFASVSVSAQTEKVKTAIDNTDKWNKPYDFGYYDMMLGYVNAPGPVYEGSAAAFWGRARTSMLSYMIRRLPRHKFQIRDVIDVQLGAGYGKGFYANIMMAGGLKFKYDISQKADFGCNVTYRFGIDEISFVTPMIHGFARYGSFFAEIGTGSNGEASSTDKQRRLTNLNLKYFLKPNNVHSWSINVTYWNIQGRNNQINNPWEKCNQFMVGIGRQMK